MSTFQFYTQFHLPYLLARRANNPSELLEGIRTVPTSSIYYHTHRFLLEHHYLLPEPSNDFAYWVTNILGLVRTGERLASVDIVRFDTLEELRQEFVNALADDIGRLKRIPEAPDGEEFHFMTCRTVVIPTPFQADNLYEFLEAIGQVSINSLYYHFFEAPLRVGQGENDFSLWLVSNGETEFAEQLSHIDPYTMTLEELRQRIVKLGRRKYARR